jgi:hypothetical protein
MIFSDPVVVALIGLTGVLITAFFGWLKVQTEQARVSQAELEMRFQRAALSFPEFVEEWSEIHKAILALMEETCIDRFLILRAWNGMLEPRWTTAMFQMRIAGQAPVAYVHFELDRDYVERLRELTATSSTYVVVKELPKNTALKDVYDSEGVTAAFLAHLISLDGPLKGTKAQTYCSFATHDPKGIPPFVQTRCRVLISRMKGLALGFEEKPI